MEKYISISTNNSLYLPSLQYCYKNKKFLSYLIYLYLFQNKNCLIAKYLDLNKQLIRNRLIKNSNILVSVIIPIFNSHEYLSETINNIITQTLTNIEIILINDASTDESLKIIQYFQKQDDRIIVINLSHNQGAGICRNIGMSIAKGEYIIFLDSDDKFSYNLLKNTYNYAVLKNADIIFWKYAINDNGKIYHNIGSPQKIYQKKNFSTLDLNFSEYTNPAPWNKLFKNKFIFKNKLFFQKLKTCNDLGFVWSSLAISEHTYYLDEELIEYKKDNKKSLSTIRSKHLIDIINACKYVINYINKNNLNYPINRIYESILNNFIYEINRCNSYKDKKEFIKNITCFLPQDYIKKLYNILYKISVIIPVYNCKNYLEQCFKSIQDQTFKYIEIIFIDDESTDGSYELLCKFKELDYRVSVIKNKHSGPGVSRNIGVNSAHGQYLFFIDSDDWIDKTCLEKLYDKIIHTNSDICLYGLTKYDDKNKIFISDSYYDLSYYKKYIDINNNQITYNSIKKCIFRRFSSFLKLYSKNFFINNNLFFTRNKLGEDVIVHVKSIILAKNISFLDENLYYYRFNRRNSIMNTYATKDIAINDIIYFLRSVKNFLYEQNLFEEFYDDYTRFVLEQFNYYINKIQNKESLRNLKIKFYNYFYELNLINNNYFINIINRYIKEDDKIINYQPEVTIIISAFNAESTLNKCLNSILSQSFYNLLVICVDDGSTDKTKSIIESYKKRDIRLKGIYKSNSGQGNSRNIALSLTKSKYVQFVDSDDWIEPLTIQKLYNFSEKYNLDILSFSGYNIKDGRKIVNDYWEYKSISSQYFNIPMNKKYKDHISIYLPVSCCLSFYNNNFLKKYKINFPNNLIYEDNVFFTKAILCCSNFAILNEKFYNRLLHSHQTTTLSLSNTSIFDIFKIYQICFNEYKKYLGQEKAISYAELKLKHLIHIYKNLDISLKKDFNKLLNQFICDFIGNKKLEQYNI